MQLANSKLWNMSSISDEPIERCSKLRPSDLAVPPMTAAFADMLCKNASLQRWHPFRAILWNQALADGR
jgi:hypothetical protein